MTPKEQFKYITEVFNSYTQFNPIFKTLKFHFERIRKENYKIIINIDPMYNYCYCINRIIKVGRTELTK